MKLSDLTKLEKLARSRNWRVRVSSTTGIDYLPGLDSPGVSQAVAAKLVARIKAIEHLGVCADPVIVDRKSTRLNSSHSQQSRMPSSA